MHRGLAFLAALVGIGLLVALPVGSAYGLSGTPTPRAQPDENDLGQICQETVDAWLDILPDDLPQHLMTDEAERSPSDFDANRLFEVFDRLSLPEGMVLDYVYYFDGMGGFPILYTRPVDQAPYRTTADLPTAADGTWDSSAYIRDILIEPTPAGYLQAALFDLLAPQFYVFWHANYGNRDIICNSTARDDMIAQVSSGDFGMPIEPEAAVAAGKLNVTPNVTIGEESATVQIIYFSYWRGFVSLKLAIPTEPPRPPLETSEDILVPYESGVMF